MSLKFRICNWIFRDYLRNYLAVDRMVIMQIADYAEKHDGKIESFQINKLKHIANDIEWLISGKEKI